MVSGEAGDLRRHRAHYGVIVIDLLFGDLLKGPVPSYILKNNLGWEKRKELIF